ncbi:hypothetical protein CY34DRAFT_248884 [Suillus luteus UH-Slu-Lm8-n1]|uniref:Uncharacterized protein n=1 Tax=Suillus luteus UH-Slu-Lm8-n1 TaxID=930992 RepID=A0A0D0AAY5_9AGAM|nr:hypothetical protein CY34DRAFT_248884 [Suillus luteus UH-Slu-Lm8-n1]
MRYQCSAFWTRHQQLYFRSTRGYITYLTSLDRHISMCDFDYRNSVRGMKLHARIAQGSCWWIRHSN